MNQCGQLIGRTWRREYQLPAPNGNQLTQRKPASRCTLHSRLQTAQLCLQPVSFFLSARAGQVFGLQFLQLQQQVAQVVLNGILGL